MSNVIKLETYVREQLKIAEAEFNVAMEQAVAFDDAGKKKFAEQMIIRAKAARKKIDKLRARLPLIPSSKRPTPSNTAPQMARFEFTSVPPFWS